MEQSLLLQAAHLSEVEQFESDLDAAKQESYLAHLLRASRSATTMVAEAKPLRGILKKKPTR